MGIRLSFQGVDDQTLASLLACPTEDELWAEFREVSQDETHYFSLGKAWDIFHYLFTGMRTVDYPTKLILSRAITGRKPVDESGNMTYLTRDQVKKISNALERLSFEDILADFSFEKCKQCGVYPDIWDNVAQRAAIKSDLRQLFEELKAFYKKEKYEEKNLLVSFE